ncbi:hypothetical protein [Erwinia tasmaniensis]|uniref:hypothetical protein n=1 Tax=Erwinia tasmaniensis TaxID=338565 RepID=UPI003A4DDAAD
MKSSLYLFAFITMMTGCQTVYEKETIPSADYQRCLDAEQRGGGDEISTGCGQLQDEINRN